VRPTDDLGSVIRVYKDGLNLDEIDSFVDHAGAEQRRMPTTTTESGAQAEEPVVTIAGERVLLGPPARGQLPLLERWENDLALSILTGDVARPLSRESIERHFEGLFKPPDDELAFVVYERATGRPIGLAGLRHINHVHRTAELGIGIGEPDCRGKGYGTEATRLVLDYAFTLLGLHNVWLRVFAYNERAIRAYRRAGFAVIGRRREAHRVGGRAYDEVLMDCLATEFSGSVLEGLVPSPPAGL
jgi:RimJ/RimL family protein N-acetyltransferase